MQRALTFAIRFLGNYIGTLQTCCFRMKRTNISSTPLFVDEKSHQQSMKFQLISICRSIDVRACVRACVQVTGNTFLPSVINSPLTNCASRFRFSRSLILTHSPYKSTINPEEGWPVREVTAAFNDQSRSIVRQSISHLSNYQEKPLRCVSRKTELRKILKFH